MEFINEYIQSFGSQLKSMPLNIPEERRHQLHSVERLKSPTRYLALIRAEEGVVQAKR
jgi:hypothetical protein